MLRTACSLLLQVCMLSSSQALGPSFERRRWQRTSLMHWCPALHHLDTTTRQDISALHYKVTVLYGSFMLFQHAACLESSGSCYIKRAWRCSSSLQIWRIIIKSVDCKGVKSMQRHQQFLQLTFNFIVYDYPCCKGVFNVTTPKFSKQFENWLAHGQKRTLPGSVLLGGLCILSCKANQVNLP